jgi:hypothetical protein
MRSVLRHDRMAWATLIMIAALLAQFVLGMAANLFVTIPAHYPGASPKNYFVGAGHSVDWVITSGLLPLAAHVILGILLIVAGFVLIVLAASSGHRGVLIASILGALFILGAAFNGASFLNFNDDLSSMIMARLFAAALACYVVVLFQLNAAQAPAGTSNVVS